jgi:hypothetical protein
MPPLRISSVRSCGRRNMASLPLSALRWSCLSLQIHPLRGWGKPKSNKYIMQNKSIPKRLRMTRKHCTTNIGVNHLSKRTDGQRTVGLARSTPFALQTPPCQSQEARPLPLELLQQTGVAELELVL